AEASRVAPISRMAGNVIRARPSPTTMIAPWTTPLITLAWVCTRRARRLSATSTGCSRRTRRSSARTARTASHTSTSSTTSTSTCWDRAPSALAIQSGTESGSPQARAYRVKKTLRSAVVQCDTHQGGGTGRSGGMKQQAAAIAFDDWLAGAEDVTYQVLVDSIPDYAIFLLDAE